MDILQDSIKDNKLFAWGIILNVLGVSISIIFKEVTGYDSSTVTNLILIASLLFIIDWKNAVFAPQIKKYFIYALIVILQFYIICSGIWVGAPILRSGSNSLRYTLYVMAFFFAVATNRTIFDEQYLMTRVLYITAVMNVITCIMIIQNGESLFDLNQSVISMDGGVERSTLSGIPFYYILAFSTTSRETRKNKIWWLFLAISLLNMFACNRRTIYVSIIICLVMLVLKRPVTVNMTPGKLLRISVMILGIVILFNVLSRIPWLDELISYSVESLDRGIRTFFSNEYEDPSVLARNQNRAAALAYLQNNSLTNWIFGRGYTFMWIDFPVLEAVLDLGIIMGAIYAVLFVLYPVVRILKSRNMSDFELFISACMLSTMLSSFSSGMPYGYTKYCPLILFAYLMEKRRSAERFMEDEAIQVGVNSE